MYTWVKRLVFVNILLWLSPYCDYWKILHYWCTSKAIFWYNVDFRWNILVWQCSWSVQTLIYPQTETTGKSGLIQRPSCVWWRLRALYMQFSRRLFNLSGWPFCNSKQSLWSRAVEKAEHSSRAQTQTAPLAGSVSNSRCILLLFFYLFWCVGHHLFVCAYVDAKVCSCMKTWAVSCVLHWQLPSSATS